MQKNKFFCRNKNFVNFFLILQKKNFKFATKSFKYSKLTKNYQNIVILAEKRKTRSEFMQRSRKEKPKEHMEESRSKPEARRSFVYVFSVHLIFWICGQSNDCNILTRAKPALCAFFDSICLMYFEKSLNSSQVGRKVWILNSGSSIALLSLNLWGRGNWICYSKIIV